MMIIKHSIIIFYQIKSVALDLIDVTYSTIEDDLLFDGGVRRGEMDCDVDVLQFIVDQEWKLILILTVFSSTSPPPINNSSLNSSLAQSTSKHISTSSSSLSSPISLTLQISTSTLNFSQHTRPILAKNQQISIISAIKIEEACLCMPVKKVILKQSKQCSNILCSGR